MILASNFTAILLLLSQCQFFIFAFPLSIIGQHQNNVLLNTIPMRNHMLTLSATKGEGVAPCNDSGEDQVIKSHIMAQENRRKFISTSTAFLNALAIGSFAVPLSSQAQQGYLPDMKGGLVKPPRALGGLPKKIRAVGNIMDELQRDLMQERWDLVERYPDQLRSYVPVFTTYTDSAFPSDSPTDNGLRVALRYEVGRFFASLERLKQATARRNLNEAYVAYSDMSLHFDRYLHVGGLYTYYDATVTNEDYFKGISRDSLVYSDPVKDPAEVRDLVVLIKGPDMGKTGIVIGIYPDGSNKCIVKLDRFMGLREIRVLPRDFVAKRLGEQNPDDVFLIPARRSGNGNNGNGGSTNSNS